MNKNEKLMCHPIILTNWTLGYVYTKGYKLPSRKEQAKIIRNAKYSGFNIIELNTGRYGKVVRKGNKLKFVVCGKIIKMLPEYDYDKYNEKVHVSINHCLNKLKK